MIPMTPLGFGHKSAYDNTVIGHKRMLKTWSNVNLTFSKEKSTQLSEIFFTVDNEDDYNKALKLVREIYWYVNVFDDRFRYMPEKYVTITISK